MNAPGSYGIHTSLSAEEVVERFTSTVNMIALAGNRGVTATHQARIRRHLTLRANGVPGNFGQRYQRNLRKAIAFTSMAESAGMTPEMQLVLMAAFTRDELATMNRTARTLALPRIIEAARGMECLSMLAWGALNV